MSSQLPAVPIRWLDTLSLASADTLARLAIPSALAALAHLRGMIALGAAIAVVALSLVRGLLTGHAVERSFRDVWGALIEATGRRSVVSLRSRPKEQSVPLLLDAAQDVAHYRATVLPRLIANAVGLGLVAMVATARVGALPSALGLLGLGALGLLAGLLQRRLRRARTSSWERYAVVARDVGALLDAASELRAHGQQLSFEARLRSELCAMARAERDASTYGALLGLFPLGVALVGVVLPIHASLGNMVELAQVRAVAEAGLIGATALVLAIGLLQTAEEAARSVPCRRAVDEFLAGAANGTGIEPGQEISPDGSRGDPQPRGAIDLRTAEIVFERASIRYPGEAARTPADVSCRWHPGVGLALTGQNGAGKSSLSLAFLGLLDLAEGDIRVAGRRLLARDWAALASKVAYLPQQAFVARAESVGWHLRLLAGSEVRGEQMTSALARVGLYSLLADRAERSGVSALDLPVGELSGGQVRRLQLARALLGEPELVVLDEPEAGLDGEGRAALRDLLAELAQSARVLVIAHDVSVVPDGFVRVECVRA